MLDSDYYRPTSLGFAGVDDRVAFESLSLLSHLYQIQWGVLVHPEKFGTPRYPNKGFLIQLNKFIEQRKEQIRNDQIGRIPRINFAIHLCGEYVDCLLEDGYTGVEDLIRNVETVQVNLAGRELTAEGRQNLETWEHHYSKYLILQVDEFPKDDSFSYINDRSRGKGVLPASWSNPRWNDEDGYEIYRDKEIWFAGGLNAQNINEACKKINDFGPHYNLDMESGVRDSNDEFSLNKCLEICETIYGRRELQTDEAGQIFAADVET